MSEYSVELSCIDVFLQAELAKELVENTLPQWVVKFEGLLKQNGGGDGWYVGSKVGVHIYF